MTAGSPGRRAVFLDRDGTLNREVEGALARPEQLELIPGAAEAAAALSRAGFALVVVSNQSAVARGWADLAQVREVNALLRQRLRAAGAELAGIYVCPHHPDQGAPPYRRACSCRKPAPGLIRRAIADLGLDPAASWLVGDADRDLQAATAAGVPVILVQTGKGARELARMRAAGRAPRHAVADLAAAAGLILGDQGR